MDVSSDGETIATGSDDKSLKVISMKNRKIAKSYENIHSSKLHSY